MLLHCISVVDDIIVSVGHMAFSYGRYFLMAAIHIHLYMLKIFLGCSGKAVEWKSRFMQLMTCMLYCCVFCIC